MSTKAEIKKQLGDYLHCNFGVVINTKTIDLLTMLLDHCDKEKLKDFKEFYIDNNPMGAHAYYIRNTDDSTTVFSYNWIIRSYTPLSKRNRLPDHIVQMQTAARNSVLEQINVYRLENNLTEEQVVDHYPVPFVKILADWYETKPEIVIATDRLPSLQSVLVEPFRKDFFEFHKQRAQYRVLSRSKNSSNGSYGIKIDWYALINAKKK